MVGFEEKDTHENVILKAAKGLGLKCDTKSLKLLCSNGLVLGTSIEDKPWTLGGYIEINGGKQSRSKKTWGLVIPVDEEENSSTEAKDSVSLIYSQVSDFRVLASMISGLFI